MKRNLLLAAICVGLSLPALAEDAPAPAKGSDPNKIVAVVNGVSLPAIYGGFIKQSRVNRGVPPESLSDDAIRDALVNVELLAQEAVRKGLDKNATVSAAVEFQRKELLGQAVIEDFVRAHPVSEETVKAEYDKAKDNAGDMEYRPRHILVPTEKEARDLIAKLGANKKLKFEDLAKKYSKDPSAGNGGDLGWIQSSNLVPEFADAMVKLKKGETGKEPVKTRFGWHVIKLDDSRKLEFPEYDKVKGRIASQLQQLQVRKFVQELRTTAKVEEKN